MSPAFRHPKGDRYRHDDAPGRGLLPTADMGRLIILAGCAVGPNFHAPPPPAVDAYRKDALPPATASANVPTGDAQRFLEAADVPERWWTQFASDQQARIGLIQARAARLADTAALYVA